LGGQTCAQEAEGAVGVVGGLGVDLTRGTPGADLPPVLMGEDLMHRDMHRDELRGGQAWGHVVRPCGGGLAQDFGQNVLVLGAEPGQARLDVPRAPRPDVPDRRDAFAGSERGSAAVGRARRPAVGQTQ
jgi:hypothetical protein